MQSGVPVALNRMGLLYLKQPKVVAWFVNAPAGTPNASRTCPHWVLLAAPHWIPARTQLPALAAAHAWSQVCVFPLARYQQWPPAAAPVLLVQFCCVKLPLSTPFEHVRTSLLAAHVVVQAGVALW